MKSFLKIFNPFIRQRIFRSLVVLLLSFLGSAQLAFSQQTVSGVVKDSYGPLLSAIIKVKGTIVGIYTEKKLSVD